MDPQNFIILSGNGNYELAEKTIRYINNSTSKTFSFSHIDYDNYADSEADFKIERPEKIKNKVVILFQSMNNIEMQEEFLTLAFACKHQYKAKYLIAVLPFFRYRRQERKEKFNEINRNLMLVKFMQAAGVDEVIFCDIHSKTTLDFCQEHNILAHNVSSAKIVAELLEPIIEDKKNLKIYSPDEGSIERALVLAEFIKAPIIYNLKSRKWSGKIEQVENEAKIKKLNEKYGSKVKLACQENVKNQIIIMFEDEIATGSTAKLTGTKLKEMGAKKLIFSATHPVCTNGWKRVFIFDTPFDHIILGNTLPRGYEKSTGGRIINASVHPVIAIRLISIMKKF